MPSQSSAIGNYNIVSKKYMSRGGNYYLGYKENGRKTVSFKKDFSGRVTEYDKYGRKVGSYK